MIFQFYMTRSNFTSTTPKNNQIYYILMNPDFCDIESKSVNKYCDENTDCR